MSQVATAEPAEDYNNDLLEKISNITVKELVDLTRLLEEKYQVKGF